MNARQASRGGWLGGSCLLRISLVQTCVVRVAPEVGGVWDLHAFALGTLTNVLLGAYHHHKELMSASRAPRTCSGAFCPSSARPKRRRMHSHTPTHLQSSSSVRERDALELHREQVVSDKVHHLHVPVVRRDEQVQKRPAPERDFRVGVLGLRCDLHARLLDAHRPFLPRPQRARRPHHVPARLPEPHVHGPAGLDDPAPDADGPVPVGEPLRRDAHDERHLRAVRERDRVDRLRVCLRVRVAEAQVLPVEALELLDRQCLPEHLRHGAHVEREDLRVEVVEEQRAARVLTQDHLVRELPVKVHEPRLRQHCVGLRELRVEPVPQRREDQRVVAGFCDRRVHAGPLGQEPAVGRRVQDLSCRVVSYHNRQSRAPVQRNEGSASHFLVSLSQPRTNTHRQVALVLVQPLEAVRDLQLALVLRAQPRVLHDGCLQRLALVRRRAAPHVREREGGWLGGRWQQREAARGRERLRRELGVVRPEARELRLELEHVEAEVLELVALALALPLALAEADRAQPLLLLFCGLLLGRRGGGCRRRAAAAAGARAPRGRRVVRLVRRVLARPLLALCAFYTSGSN
ncbi:hypothetical protein PybrP1_009171 [[Pythium] brassicae (nom. inval.)]|nr:hypothetical protein PybrP1_009171 [[Pythium] brassicae (nom. inval.)]